MAEQTESTNNEVTEKENFQRKKKYTNLTETYIYKMVILLFIVFLTIIRADNLETLLTGAMTFIPCIFMDLHIIIISNNGPRIGKLIFLAKILKGIIFLAGTTIVCYVLTGKNVQTLTPNWRNAIKEVLEYFMLLLCILSPLTELFVNMPEDD